MSTLKAYCESLSLAVPVRNLSLVELSDLYTKLKEEIKKKQKPIKITYFYKWIIDKLLVNPEEFFEFVAKDPLVINELDDADKNKQIHVSNEIVDSMYTGIVNVYPVFDVEQMFATINAEATKSTSVSEIIPKPSGDTNKPVDLNKESIKAIEKTLRSKLIGQSAAIDNVISKLKLQAAGIVKHVSLFFVGPTGCGKSELSKLVAANLGNKLIKINCAEMSHGHEHQKYIGAPPGFVGHSESSFLKEKADKSSQWVFLFDEIEKASPKFFDFLLNLVDEGTVIDNLGTTLDFTKSIFFFTSNEGIDKIKYDTLSFSVSKDSYGDGKETIKKSLESMFKPEFLNRLDDIVIFNSLTKEHIRDIIELELRTLPLHPTKELIEYVLANGYSEKYGARNIKRYIRNNIAPKIADFLLDEPTPAKHSFYIPLFVDNVLTFKKVNTNVLDKEVQADKVGEKGKEKNSKRRNLGS